MSPASVRRIVMLLVEDNPADVVFFREAAGETKMAADIHVVVNGTDALRFLRQEAPFDHAPRPDVVVLDLNLPLKNGQEVMLEMASDSVLSTFPVAILTTSTSETCVCEMYPKGRCLYFTKTDDFKGLQEIVKQIHALASPANGPGT